MVGVDDNTGEQGVQSVHKRSAETTHPENGNDAGASANPKKVPKTTPTQLSRKERKQTPAYKLRSAVQICCKANDLAQALQLYQDAVAQHIPIDASVYYSLLALCDGVQHNVLHIGRPQPQISVSAITDPEKTIPATDATDGESTTAVTATTKEAIIISLEERKQHAIQIKAAMDAAKIPLNEASYTALVKLFIKTNDVATAYTLLLESETVPQCKPKLRLYAALLHAYAEHKPPQAVKAVQIWLLLTQQHLQVTEREYLALLRCAVTSQSPILMECILTDLAEDVPVPSMDTHTAIIDWFTSPAATCTPGNNSNAVDEVELVRLLQQIHTLQNNPQMRVVSPSMGPVQSTTGWHISRACRISHDSSGTLTTGCLVHERLHPIAIAQATWEDMRTASTTIGRTGQLAHHGSAFRGGGKGSKRLPVDPQKRQRHWNGFLKYLEHRKGHPINVVVDGANVGFHKQTGAAATTTTTAARPGQLSYEPIDWVIRSLQQDYGKSVLVVMHSRHFAPGKVPRQHQAMVDGWFQQRLIYKTPPGMDDDTFWMHVALSRPGTLVVTNDEMRDHHFQMLAPRCFLRWKDRHQVKFTFGRTTTTRPKLGSHAVVQFSFPEAYTRRMQRVADGLVVPYPKRGDTHRFLDGVAVLSAQDDHVPDVETYLCIRPK